MLPDVLFASLSCGLPDAFTMVHRWTGRCDVHQRHGCFTDNMERRVDHLKLLSCNALLERVGGAKLTFQLRAQGNLDSLQRLLGSVQSVEFATVRFYQLTHAPNAAQYLLLLTRSDMHHAHAANP